MGSFNPVALTVLKICAFRVRKTAFFFGKFSAYEILKSGDKISNFRVLKIGFEVDFCNICWTGWQKSIIDPIMESKFSAANVELVKI